MELKERPVAPMLAHKLGDVPHVSGLLRRIAQLSGASERVADWLLKVAVARGANHYRRDFDPILQTQELEIVLTPDWLSRRVRVPVELRKLTVFRPDTLDFHFKEVNNRSKNLGL